MSMNTDTTKENVDNIEVVRKINTGILVAAGMLLIYSLIIGN